MAFVGAIQHTGLLISSEHDCYQPARTHYQAGLDAPTFDFLHILIHETVKQIKSALFR